MLFRGCRRSGFTLVEAATSWGFVTLLIALLMPAVQQSREAARRAQCRNNLKQMMIGLHNYHDQTNTFPFGWVGVDAKSKKPAVLGANGFGWETMLLPMVEQSPLYHQFNFSVRVDEKENVKGIAMSIPLLRCPSDTFLAKTWKIKDAKDAVVLELATTNYVASFGTEDLAMCEKMKLGEVCKGNGLFYHNSRIGIRDITDGTSNTIAIGERSGDEKTDHLSTWSGVIAKGTHPFSRILGSSQTGLNSKERHASDYFSKHAGGSHFALTDGAVRFFSKDIDVKTFQALTTRAGGEVVGDF